MTQEPSGDRIPALTLGWRMRMALDYANINVQQMAGQLGVSRTTLSRWMADKGERPKRAYLSQWALSTGVPFEWIDTGKVSTSGDNPDDDGGGRRPSRLGGTPTDQYGHLPPSRLLHLPNEPWLIAAQTPPTLATLTKASTGLAA